MINYIKSTEKDMDMLIESRMEMLKVVNNLPDNYKFNDDFIEASKIFFESSNQTTILAINEDKKIIGCASMCYIEIMPTFSHPTGKRAHLMNVYTNARFRRQGIAKKMLEILINEAKERGVTEISLDTTETGRAFYKSCGFKESEECMVLDLGSL
jgi:ribosomal protein S18 acetylase RimI-like enzyme